MMANQLHHIAVHKKQTKTFWHPSITDMEATWLTKTLYLTFPGMR